MDKEFMLQLLLLGSTFGYQVINIKDCIDYGIRWMNV